MHTKGFGGLIADYYKAMSYALLKPKPKYTLFKGIMTGFDNTARKAEPLIYANATPILYEYWLKQAIMDTREILNKDERFVFINAWNEWAEGAYLEPDGRYGYAYLNSTAKALRTLSETCDE